MRKLLSIFSIRKVVYRSLTKESPFWTSWLVLLLTLKILRWLFSRPKPVVFEEYELDPGEYKISVKKGR